MSWGFVAAGALTAAGSIYAAESAPDAPDPYAVARSQSASNIATAREEAKLNRYNQYTPYGDLLWDQPKVFDEAGYNEALAKYEKDMALWNARPAEDRVNSGGRGGRSNPRFHDKPPVAPTKAQFTPSNGPWTSTVKLSPQAQRILDAQLNTSEGLGGTINTSLDRVTDTYSQGIDAEQLPEVANTWGTPRDTAAELFANRLDAAGQATASPLSYDAAPSMPGADNNTRQSVENALYGRMTSRLDPQYAQRQQQLESQLTNQGITLGSEAWDTATGNLERDRTDAYQSAMDSSIVGGGAEMERQFGLGMAARQQGIGEINSQRAQPMQEAGFFGDLNSATRDQMLQERAVGLDEQYTNRNQVINELNALRTGSQVTTPQFTQQAVGANIAGTPLAQSVYNSYQGNVDKYNAQVGTQNSMMSGLAGLGSAYIANR